MNKKISQYFIEHSVRCTVMIFSCILAIGVVVFLSPRIVAEVIGGCLTGFMFFLMIFSIQKEKKEKQELQAMGTEDYKQKWKKYVDLVNEVFEQKKYKKDKLDEDWIEEFNKTINCIATDQYLLDRKFNDFDIAACLVYSLTCMNDTDENVLFAFECIKKIISEPKDYNRDIGYGYKLELEVDNTYSKVDINIPDDVITPKALAAFIRSYRIQETESGIIQLSDFLHVLYLRCKNN